MNTAWLSKQGEKHKRLIQESIAFLHILLYPMVQYIHVQSYNQSYIDTYIHIKYIMYKSGKTTSIPLFKQISSWYFTFYFIYRCIVPFKKIKHIENWQHLSFGNKLFQGMVTKSFSILKIIDNGTILLDYNLHRQREIIINGWVQDHVLLCLEVFQFIQQSILIEVITERNPLTPLKAKNPYMCKLLYL